MLTVCRVSAASSQSFIRHDIVPPSLNVQQTPTATATRSTISTENGEARAKDLAPLQLAGNVDNSETDNYIDGAISGTAPAGSSAGQKPDISPSAPAYRKRDTEQMVHTLPVFLASR